jgi:hypothetical protein
MITKGHREKPYPGETEAISYERVPNIADRIRPNNFESIKVTKKLSLEV